jgi:uncharacterized protein
MTTRRWVAGAIAAAAALLLLGRVVAIMYADYLWYLAHDAVPLWRAKTITIALVTGLTGILSAAVVFVNLYAVRRSIVALILPRRLGDLEIGEEVPPTFLTLVAAALSVLFGALLALPRTSWTSFWLAAKGLPFRESDPYLQADLGFFVYRLPAETSLYYWALITLLLVSALVVFLYALTPSLRWERGTLHVSTWVRRHLAMLVAVLLVLLAWSYRLDTWETLVIGSGPDGAFTSVDRTVLLRAMPFLSLITFAAAAVVAISGWTGQLRATLGAIAIVLVTSVAIRQVVPAIVSRSTEVPTQELRERSYLAVRAGYTRRAYDSDRVITAIPGATGEFSSWPEAVAGIPAWDPAPLRRAAEWARRAGEPVGSTGWQATTSGLSAMTILAPDVDDEGRAGAWGLVRSLPARPGDRGELPRDAGAGAGTRDDRPLPQILVHPGAGSYAMVTDSMGRVAGAPLDVARNRLAHAWSEQNFRLMSSDQPRENVRIVLHRDVRDRLRTLVPFFVQGSDITPLIVRDSLHWVVELYSASSSYPLSERLQLAGESRSYFRHAATAIIHATTGRILLATPAAPDPHARSWISAFPTIFTPRESLPDAIGSVLPPPHDAVLAQATTFARYGTRGDEVTDGRIAWLLGADSIAGEGTRSPIALGENQQLAWSHVVLRPDETVSGLVVATGGSTPALAWIPSAGGAPHWPTLVERMRRASDSLAVARDPGLVRGPVRAVPMQSGLAFIQSSYTWRTTAPPTLEQVALFSGDAISVGPTLREAAGLRLSDPVTRALTADELAAQAGAAYDRMRAALERGDLRAFAEAYEELGALLGRGGR